MSNIQIAETDYLEIRKTIDIQFLLLYLYKIFKSICESNGLRYYAFGGTLLGAVRHNGFIPWDDDIDVGMPRPDYDKLIELMKTSSDNRVELLSYPTKNYIYPFCKFCLTNTVIIEKYMKKYSRIKLFIDVFPVDGYPPAEKEKKHFDKLRHLKKLRTFIVEDYTEPNPTKEKHILCFRRLVQKILSLIPMKQIIKAEINESKRYIYEKSEYLSFQGAGWNEKGKVSRTVANDIQEYKFEDSTILGFKHPEEYLTNLYGDYMTIPPPEKQTSNHDYHLFISKSLKCIIEQEK